MRRLAAVIILFSLLPLKPAHAELGGADTIELMVARADTVAFVEVGSVTGKRVTFNVIEILRGHPESAIQLALPAADFKDEKSQHEKILLFLVYDKAQPQLDGVIHLSAPRPQAYTMDFDSLVGEQGIVAAVRAAAATKAPKPAKSISVAAPWSSPASRDLSAGSASYLRMPVDAQLEHHAQNWIARGYEEQAVQALREFPSRQNAQIMRRLLSSDSAIVYPRSRLGQVSYYTVRALAWRTLREWGESVERPVIQVPQDYYHPVRWWGGLLTFLVLIAPAIAIATLAHRRRIRFAVAALLAMVTFTMLISWMRDDHAADEFYYDGDSRQVWLSSYRGWFQFTLVTDWPGRYESRDYVPLGYRLDGTGVGRVDPAWPRRLPSRGCMFASIPLKGIEKLWTTPPSTVQHNDDWAAAKLLRGVQEWQDDKGAVRDLSFLRAQVRWAVLVPLLGAFPLACFVAEAIRILRGRHRRKAGLCLHCGYDLRGSPNRCPECGQTAQTELSHAAATG